MGSSGIQSEHKSHPFGFSISYPFGFSENPGVCLYNIFQSGYLIWTPYLLGSLNYVKAAGGHLKLKYHCMLIKI